MVRLKGQGVPHVRGRGRGDLRVRYVVRTPDRPQRRGGGALPPAGRAAGRRGGRGPTAAWAAASAQPSSRSTWPRRWGPPARSSSSTTSSVPDLADGDRHHLERALRLRAGDPLVVADGAGSWRPVRFGGRGRARRAMWSPSPVRPPADRGPAPVKGDRPEWAVQKLTELGVDRIVPSHRPVGGALGGRPGRPPPRAAAPYRPRGGHAEPAVVAARGRRCAPPGRPSRGGPGRPRRSPATLGGGPPGAVRPEGGWSDEERAAVRDRVGLGPARPAGRDGGRHRRRAAGRAAVTGVVQPGLTAHRG